MSSLSDGEFVEIVGTYAKLTNGRKESGLEARGYSPEALAAARQIAAATFNPVVSCGLRFTKPLDQFNYDQMGYALTLFENYEKGNLPFPGSVSDQPAQIIEIFGLLKALRQEQEQRKSLENGRHNRKNNAGPSR